MSDRDNDYDDDRVSPSAATSEVALAKLRGESTPDVQIRQRKGQALTYVAGDNEINQLDPEASDPPMNKPAGGGY